MMVRTAVVGLGWAGRELWLPRLRAHPDFTAVAVVDPDRTSDPAQIGVPVHPSLDAVDPGSVDFAIVAVPNYLHAEVASTLLRRGVAVFVEKPVCLTGAEADALAAAECEGGMLLAGSAACHRGDVLVLAELTRDLGRIRHIELAWVRTRGVPQAGGWFTQRGKAGGGALVDLGWHLLDVLTLLVGPARVDRAIATMSDDFIHFHEWSAAWRQDQRVARPVVDVEDSARGFFVRDDGISVALRACWASHEARDLSLIRVEGSAGVAELRCTFGFSPNRQPESVLTITRRGATSRIPLPTEPIGIEYRRQLDSLATTLADPANRGRAIAAAREIAVFVESVYASARDRLPVSAHR